MAKYAGVQADALGRDFALKGGLEHALELE
jgi:hypothetical protein